MLFPILRGARKDDMLGGNLQKKRSFSSSKRTFTERMRYEQESTLTYPWARNTQDTFRAKTDKNHGSGGEVAVKGKSNKKSKSLKLTRRACQLARQDPGPLEAGKDASSIPLSLGVTDG